MDTWNFLIEGVGVAGGLAGIAGLWLQFSPSAEKIELWIDTDPSYREKLASELRDSRVGSLYGNTLALGLDWLDRLFGHSRSLEALGVCIIISLAYAWAAFFLDYAIAGVGKLGALAQLPSDLAFGPRMIVLMTAWALPILAFILGRSVGRQERKLKVWLYRRLPALARRRFGVVYGIATIFIMVAITALLIIVVQMVEPTSNEPLPLALALGVMFALGPAAGALCWQWFRHFASRQLYALTAGAVVVVLLQIAGTMLLKVFVLSPALLAIFAVAMFSAQAAAFAVGFLGVAVLALVVIAAMLAEPAAASGAVSAVLAGAAVATLTASVAAMESSSRRGGVWAGGIGGFVGWALLVLVVDDRTAPRDYVTLLLVFLCVLPTVNGLWDWLSWMVSRGLGRHLLGMLTRERRAWVIAWHALADMLVAIALLAFMAFTVSLGLEAYNQIAALFHTSGLKAFELRPVIEAAAEAPLGDGLWLSVMLLTTLLPTALHLILLFASPIAVLCIADERRLALAVDLECYASQSRRLILGLNEDSVAFGNDDQRQAGIRRRAVEYIRRERHLAIITATALFGFLLVLLVSVVTWIHDGGLADYVKDVALAGIWTAERIF